MTMPSEPDLLPPLLGRVFPPHGLDRVEQEAIRSLQLILDTEIAPQAAANDARGRYPMEAIAALKRSGILASAIPRAMGGLGFSHRASMEAQLRIAAADSAVSQIYKIHEECLREAVVNAPDEFRPALIKAVLEERKILGLAVAEAGRKVDDPMQTLYQPRRAGGGLVTGKKVYTTGAAGADIIVVWSFDPTTPGIAENPVLGLRVSLVPAATPGIAIHRDWDAMGQRATDSGTITFTALQVEPEWNGQAPGRFPSPQAPLVWQLGFAANLIGNAVGAFRAACPFVRDRSRPWPSSGADNAADDPYVRRLAGELAADLAAAYALTLSAADLLDAFVRGAIDRTTLAIPIYAAKSAASRAALRATTELFALMGTRSVAGGNGFDRFWRNARTVSLHDPVDWKHAEIGRHILFAWEPPWGIYQ
jgi:alkylation response protein AidB-like acyl-CoA dehydrogenase